VDGEAEDLGQHGRSRKNVNEFVMLVSGTSGVSYAITKSREIKRYLAVVRGLQPQSES
jgi:hypothetical protein